MEQSLLSSTHCVQTLGVPWLTPHPSPLQQSELTMHDRSCVPHVGQFVPVHGVTQCPSTQVSPIAHEFVHEPQCAVSVVRFVSQPSAALWLQSVKPAWHVMPQLPRVQLPTAFLASRHTRPHAPQLCASFAVWISQPSTASRLQLARPVGQQIAFEHIAAAQQSAEAVHGPGGALHGWHVPSARHTFGAQQRRFTPHDAPTVFTQHVPDIGAVQTRLGPQHFTSGLQPGPPNPAQHA